jgi:hypothetical protein
MQYGLKTASNLRNPRGIKKAMPELRHSEHSVFKSEFTRVQKAKLDELVKSPKTVIPAKAGIHK